VLWAKINEACGVLLIKVFYASPHHLPVPDWIMLQVDWCTQVGDTRHATNSIFCRQTQVSGVLWELSA